jgi:YVTN family beta-propeller protein
VASVLGVGGFAVVRATSGSSSASSFIPVSPVRVLDTRSDLGLAAVRDGVAGTLKVTGSIPTATSNGVVNAVVVPAGATAVVLNVTAVNPTSGGYVSLRPGDATGAPTVSTLNVTAGGTFPNGATITIPTTGAHAGQIQVWYEAEYTTVGSTELLIDVAGYYELASTGPTGPTGSKGDDGEKGDAGSVSASCVALLRWENCNKVSATVAVGSAPGYVVFDGTNIWVTNTNSNTVSKIDPIANNVIATVAVGSRPNGIVFDGTNIWVANTGQNFLSKINMNGTSSENVLVNINIQIVNVGYNGRLIYVSLRQGDQGNLDYGLVIAFDPKDGSSGSVCFVCVGAQQFASDGYRMWVANENRSLIGFGLSPLDDARVDLIFSPRSLAFDGKDIWATSPINDAVYKINPDGESTGLMIEVGDSPLGIAFDGTSIWVANSGSNSVSKIPV